MPMRCGGASSFWIERVARFFTGEKRSVLTPIGVVFWWVGRDELDGPANPAVILERARSSSGFHR